MLRARDATTLMAAPNSPSSVSLAARQRLGVQLTRRRAWRTSGPSDVTTLMDAPRDPALVALAARWRLGVLLTRRKCHQQEMRPP